MQDLTPYHDAYDKAKLANLVADMSVNGWQGQPLVQYGGALLNGSHRWEAAQIVAIDDYQFEPEVVDLLDEFDLNEDEILDFVNSQDNWQYEVTRMAIAANPKRAEELGMDIH
jgi:ParB-like chromosome segregation protein Spo0J